MPDKKTISVLDFGADPTGKKDSTDAIRRALAAARKLEAKLDMPQGKYRTSGTIDLGDTSE